MLHIAESAYGGVGTYLNTLYPALAGAIDARLLVPREHRFVLKRVPDAAIIEYRRDGRSAAALFRLIAASARAIRTFRPQIIHLHSTFAGLSIRPLLVALRAMPGPRPAIVYGAHGWAFDILPHARRHDAIAVIERMLARVTDRIVVLSDREHERCRALGFGADKLVRIYNGAPATPALPPATWEDPRLKVLFVGRFDRQKGIDTLFTAAAGAIDRITVRCAGGPVVGDVPALEAPANVTLLGWLDEAQVAAQLALADVVVVPSRWEGFGLVAAEAMRAARPVVASRVGGLAEVVVDGETGRLVPPEDPAALCAALLADDADTRHRMGAAGRQRYLRKFTTDHSAAALLAAYRDTVRDVAAHRAGCPSPPEGVRDAG